MPTKLITKLAVLSFEIAVGADGVTTEAHLLPPGPFRGTDDRPRECDAWMLDAAIAAQVIARMAELKNDTLIDYEHQSLRSEWNGQPVIAAGWFHEMEWREGKGLYAVGIGWTANAKTRILAKEYRYISAVFFYYERTGEVMEIVSVALTNTPALDGLDSLDMAALSKRFDLLKPTKENDMATEKEQLAALAVERDGLSNKVASLTVERDGLSTQVAALTTERDTLKTRVEALDQEKATAALTKETEDHKALLKVALTEGLLAPAQKTWAEKQPLASLTEYLATKNPLALLTKQVDGKQSVAALTAEQAAMAKKMGVSEEDYLVAQNSK